MGPGVNSATPSSGWLLLRTAMRPSGNAATWTQVPLFPLKLLIRHEAAARCNGLDTVCASERYSPTTDWMNEIDLLGSRATLCRSSATMVYDRTCSASCKYTAP